MATTAEVDVSGRVFAENVKRLRKKRDLTLRDLEARLRDAGRPILASGLLRLEQAKRRVDVDEVFALAAVLGVTPGALLEPNADDDSYLRAVDLADNQDPINAAISAVRTLAERGLPVRAVVDYVEYIVKRSMLPPEQARMYPDLTLSTEHPGGNNAS